MIPTWKSTIRLFVVISICSTVSVLASAQQKRTADQIIREFRQVHMPTMSNGNSPEAVRKFKEAIDGGCRQQARLAQELYRLYPDHEQVPALLSTRWAGMNNALGQSKDVLEETLALLKKEQRTPIRHKAVLAACRATLLLDDVSLERKLRYANAACEVVPEEEAGPLALVDIAKYHMSDVKKMKELCLKVAKGWGKTQWAGPAAKSVLKKLDRLGTQLEIEAEDFLADGKISTKSMAGRPFIVMVYSGFFETSEQELGRIKDAKAKSKLDVISVYNFRFQKGKAALAENLKKRGVTWPHYYSYKKGQSPWSGNWAASETPLYYVVGKDGRIASVAYRFKNAKVVYDRLKAEKPATRARKL